MNPKLIACDSCKKEVSIEAPGCPHCGAPVKKPLSFAQICVRLMGVAVFGFFGLAIILSSSEKDSEPARIYALNEPAKAGHMEWVVKNVRTSSGFSSDLGSVRASSTETILIFVSGRLTNRSTETDSSFGGLLYLIDASQTTYGESMEGRLVADPINLESLNPNVPKKFSAIFEVPKNARGLKFKATDLATLGEEVALIDLGLDRP